MSIHLQFTYSLINSLTMNGQQSASPIHKQIVQLIGVTNEEQRTIIPPLILRPYITQLYHHTVIYCMVPIPLNIAWYFGVGSRYSNLHVTCRCVYRTWQRVVVETFSGRSIFTWWSHIICTSSSVSVDGSHPDRWWYCAHHEYYCRPIIRIRIWN